MACPNCDGDNLSVLDEKYDDDHHVEIYQCDDCSCIFKWESTRTIEEEGEKEEEHKKAQKPIIPEVIYDEEDDDDY